MLLTDFIQSKFTNCKHLTLRDDGEGVFVDVWECEEPKPTKGQVALWVKEHQKGANIKKTITEEINDLKATNANILMKLALNGIR